MGSWKHLYSFPNLVFLKILNAPPILRLENFANTLQLLLHILLPALAVRWCEEERPRCTIVSEHQTVEIVKNQFHEVESRLFSPFKSIQCWFQAQYWILMVGPESLVCVSTQGPEGSSLDHLIWCVSQCAGGGKVFLVELASLAFKLSVSDGFQERALPKSRHA